MPLVQRPEQIHFAAIMSVAIFAFAPVFADSPIQDATKVGEQVELMPSDLEEITAHVLTTDPIVSSSPGIKYAGAHRTVRSLDMADVIYYPHEEIAGLRRALQVKCLRQIPVGRWNCERARIRSYLQIDSQDFEVRVLDGIDANQALALIEATRPVALAHSNEAQEVPRTAIMMMWEIDAVVVSWGNRQGHQQISVAARLVEGGNSADWRDWRAEIYEYPQHTEQ